MLELILLIVGITYIVRHFQMRRLSVQSHPNVDPERFSAWQKARLQANGVVLLATWAVFLAKLGIRITFIRTTLAPKTDLLIVIACLAVWAGLLILSSVLDGNARQLGEAAGISEPARIGPAGRFIGALFSPSATFADVGRKATWLAPIVLAMLTTWAFADSYNWKMKPDYEQILRKQMKQRAERTGTEMPKEEDIRRFAAISGKAYVVSFVLGVPIIYLFLAGVFALGMLLMQAQASFLKILSVIAWTNCATGVVAAIVVAASVMTQDVETFKTVPWYLAPTYSATNLGAVLPSDASAVLKALAQSIDVFSIWRLILFTIGFSAIAGSRKTSPSSLAFLVFVVWLLGVLFSVAAAALGFAPS